MDAAKIERDLGQDDLLPEPGSLGDEVVSAPKKAAVSRRVTEVVGLLKLSEQEREFVDVSGAAIWPR